MGLVALCRSLRSHVSISPKRTFICRMTMLSPYHLLWMERLEVAISEFNCKGKKRPEVLPIPLDGAHYKRMRGGDAGEPIQLYLMVFLHGVSPPAVPAPGP